MDDYTDYAGAAAMQRARLGIVVGQGPTWRETHCGLHFGGYAPCILAIGHQELKHQDANGHQFNIPSGHPGYLTGDTKPLGSFTASDAGNQPIYLSRAIECPLCHHAVHDGDHEALYQVVYGVEVYVMTGHRTCIQEEVIRQNG